MAKKRYTKKQCRKRFDGKCFFCGIADYDLLDSHRIFEGQDGGKYNWDNVMTCCALCHRKCHAGIIKVLGKHPSTSGRWFVNYIDEEGNEQWKAN